MAFLVPLLSCSPPKRALNYRSTSSKITMSPSPKIAKSIYSDPQATPRTLLSSLPTNSSPKKTNSSEWGQKKYSWDWPQSIHLHTCKPLLSWKPLSMGLPNCCSTRKNRSELLTKWLLWTSTRKCEYGSMKTTPLTTSWWLGQLLKVKIRWLKT